MNIKKKLSLNIAIGTALLLSLFFIIFIFMLDSDFFKINESFYAYKNKYVFLFILSILSISIAVFILCYWISFKISNSLKEINRIIEKLKTGDTSNNVAGFSVNEIDKIAVTLGDLAEKIDKEAKNVAKLERIRSEFLGNVSHELRTPIFSIQGYVETLLNGAIKDDAVNIDFLNKIQKYSDRLSILLNDLIEISRIESQEIKFSFRFFDIQELASSVIEEMKQKAVQKQVNLIFKPLNKKSVQVFADKDRIRQVMTNLIDNALKYNRENGSIEMFLHEDKDNVITTIQDTGIGIPREDMPRIFERFFRVDKNRSREMGGTGLGLAIVKHIIEAHKSEVFVESKIGEGSKFSFGLSKKANLG